MSPRSVVIAHREAMVAEGIAAALARYPKIRPVGVATSAAEGEHRAEQAHTLVLDQNLPGARDAASRLRRKGVRVLYLGETGGEGDEEMCISTQASVAMLASAIVPEPNGGEFSRSLTAREREVLSLVAEGFAAKQVARQLGISPKTVEQHKARIFAKLGVSNQTAAVSFAVACGFGRGNAAWIPSST